MNTIDHVLLKRRAREVIHAGRRILSPTERNFLANWSAYLMRGERVIVRMTRTQDGDKLKEVFEMEHFPPL